MLSKETEMHFKLGTLSCDFNSIMTKISVTSPQRSARLDDSRLPLVLMVYHSMASSEMALKLSQTKSTPILSQVSKEEIGSSITSVASLRD